MPDQEKIKNLIEEMLKKMGIEFQEVAVNEDSQGKRAFVIKTNDSGILIGTKGAHIGALNHLLKRIVGKASDRDEDKAERKEADFYVDVNDYHDKLVTEIKNKAQILAERARSFKVDVEMDPMSPYERMIVHSFFENTKDIVTESRGAGDKRRVVLKYKEETQI